MNRLTGMLAGAALLVSCGTGQADTVNLGGQVWTIGGTILTLGGSPSGGQTPTCPASSAGPTSLTRQSSLPDSVSLTSAIRGT